MSDDFAADLALAEAAAREAGAIVMQYFGTDLDVVMKSPGQPLTEADLAANVALHNALAGARPDYGWLSEETRDSTDRLGRRRVWIVDPIDGTRSFIARRPEFTISIGLVVDGAAVVGVVYNPARDELFSAVAGGTAHVATGGAVEPLVVAQRMPDAMVTLLASRSEIARGEFDPFRDTWHIEPAGSTAYKLALVASGNGHAFISRGPKSEWDICGGVVIVEAAGGVVTDVNGAVPRFNNASPYVHGIVAANAGLHEDLIARIGELPLATRFRIEE
ncbi:MAG TPA: 3'(2'),5'-bisphosphate nucleotidase CysQ [Longimicrobiales bacterium]|nr:3'(2'),5'-bisphosphate nucleotidase CysQ [Longimicrobiales bacterium]